MGQVHFCGANWSSGGLAKRSTSQRLPRLLAGALDPGYRSVCLVQYGHQFSRFKRRMHSSYSLIENIAFNNGCWIKIIT
jgi:hypothetical protein